MATSFQKRRRIPDGFALAKIILLHLAKAVYNSSMSKSSKNTSLDLEKEVELLRSYAIGKTGKDSEEIYRPEFVESVFKSLKERPTQIFESPEGFLKQLKSVE